MDTLDAIVTADYVRTGSRSARTSSLAEAKAEILAVRGAFPDLATEVHAVVADGDNIAVFWSSEGTHTEPYLGVPATNRRVRTSGSNHLRLSAGKIAVEAVTWDGSELLESLGIRSLRDGSADEHGHFTSIVDDLSADPDGRPVGGPGPAGAQGLQSAVRHRRHGRDLTRLTIWGCAGLRLADLR